MIKKSVKLNSMKEVEKFNHICSKYSCDVDLQTGKYYVVAKYFMGIFSFDLEHPLTLRVDSDDDIEVSEKYKDFLV
ncbi:MAG: HPr family phosphocarrier protein [Lacrimispora sphenoides]